MKQLITERFCKVEGFYNFNLTQQAKIINAFVKGYWNHDLETWQCRMGENGIICNFNTSTTLIRGEEDVLNLDRYSNFDLKKWFKRILGDKLEEDSYISFGNGGFIKLIKNK